MSYNRPSPRRSTGKIGATRSIARLRSVLTATVGRVNTGRTTVADYLTGLGADSDLIRRYASPVGRAIAKAYRTTTGQEPEQTGLAIVGLRLTRAFAYRTADLPLIAQVVGAYEVKKPARVRLLDLIGA